MKYQALDVFALAAVARLLIGGGFVVLRSALLVDMICETARLADVLRDA